jgi:dihydrofolate reductase
MIYLVAAVSMNGVIGGENKLIWNLPHDLKRFKEITIDQVVVMGRKTHESIGRALPNRLNVVLSNNLKWNNLLGHNCVVCYSIEEVLEKFKHRDLYVIGGGEIYKMFLPLADKIYLTQIDKEFDGDTFFPQIDYNNWSQTNIESFKNNEFDYHFITLEKH